MKRRDFVAGLGAATVLPTVVLAQQKDHSRRVDILVAEATEDDPYYERRIATIRDRLRELGWIEGQNLQLVVHRTAPKAADVRKHVDELLAGRPDVIVTSGGTTTAPVLQSTDRVPIVFIAAVDPIGAGFVESLARPGGNATGFMQFDYRLSAKWLELLKQIAPSITRAGIIRDPAVTSGIGQFAVIQSVARALGIEVIPIGVRDGQEVEKGISKIARAGEAGLVATIAAAVNGHRDQIIKLAAQLGLPAVYGNRIWVESGGLISYGPDLVESSRLAAGYVDRILKGERPADLPVQTPTKYEFAVNLKTAKALGLTVPAALIGSADAVVE
jgi:putative tryptophan/tyrosine transport system substrate-binding protein